MFIFLILIYCSCVHWLFKLWVFTSFDPFVESMLEDLITKEPLKYSKTDPVKLNAAMRVIMEQWTMKLNEQKLAKQKRAHLLAQPTALDALVNQLLENNEHLPEDEMAHLIEDVLKGNKNIPDSANRPTTTTTTTQTSGQQQSNPPCTTTTSDEDLSQSSEYSQEDSQGKHLDSSRYNMVFSSGSDTDSQN